MTSIGYYRVVGEIENVGDRNFGNIILEVNFYEADGNMIRSINSSSTLSSLSPDRKSSFGVYLTDEAQSLMVNSYEVHVINYTETTPLEKKLNFIYYKYDNVSIYGEIENKGYEEAKFVRIFATFYDENETVVDTGAFMINSMERATTMSFEVAYPGVDALNRSIFERARWYSLTAESREYGLDPEVPLTYFTFPENGAEADGNYIFYVFAILVGISAAGLLTVFLIAKAREKAKRRHIRRTRKSSSYHAGLPDLLS
jgi:tetrahydromethanopterin S-methyltransferase subunit B